MAKILGVDGGNDRVKIFGENGAMGFLSVLGDYRERKLDQLHSKDDMIYEFNGQKGFAGTLAKYESEFKRSIMGDSKAHKDLLIRVLLGLHRYSDDEVFRIVVGQPIRQHTKEEKQRIIDLLEGTHEFRLNGVTKEIIIDKVAVGAEGGAAFWSAPRSGKVRILDVGSGTVNYATIEDGRYIDRDSDSLRIGVNTTKSKDLTEFARMISAEVYKKWERDDYVLVCGGVAEKIVEPLGEFFANVGLLQPMVTLEGESKLLSPIYANAVGFYEIGKKVFK